METATSSSRRCPSVTARASRTCSASSARLRGTSGGDDLAAPSVSPCVGGADPERPDGRVTRELRVRRVARQHEMSEARLLHRRHRQEHRAQSSPLISPLPCMMDLYTYTNILIDAKLPVNIGLHMYVVLCCSRRIRDANQLTGDATPR